MKITKLLLCFSLSFVTIKIATAQKNDNNSLLWRISGNGLSKSSYLFGTMHLKDRRLFQFGDSVYKNIEAASGFAMEIDPNEMLDSVLSNYSKADTTSLLRKMLDKKKYDAVAKKLEKKTGKPADKITRKMLVELRDSWAFKVKKSDDMNAAVDMYLFDIARRQGKWTGGIEDVSDQLNLGDELGRTVDIEDLVDDDKVTEKQKMAYLEKMISVYVNNDLQTLDEIVNTSHNSRYRDIMLIRRNAKMAYRIDSLAHVRNTFFAIGVAHLAGDSGVIELLQARGFKVEPVHFSQRIAPEKYVFKQVDIPWVTYAGVDSAYTASLPGKPTDMSIGGNIFTMKVYADLTSSLVFLNGYYFLAEDEKPENSYKRMMAYFSGDQAKPELKDIKLNGLDGKEIISEKDDHFYRTQLYFLDQKMYLMMVGAEKKELLNSKDADKYLQSFIPNGKLAPKKQQWLKQTLTDYAFEIEFPGKPSVDILKGEDLPEGIEGATYSLLQQPGSHYFLAVVSQTKKGFFIESDTTILNGKLNYYKQLGSKIEDLRYFKYEGFPAVSFDAFVKNNGFDGVVKMLVVSRGNRNYTIAVVSEKGKENYPEVTQYFRQFKLLPQTAVTWRSVGANNKLFSTFAPSEFELKKVDSAALATENVKQRPRYESFDAGLLNTWYVNVDAINPYQWYNNDSSFIAGEISRWYSDTAGYFAKDNPGNFDSLISRRQVSNGKATGVEIVVKNAAKSFYKQIRILRHGDSTYTLIGQAFKEVIDSENNRRFFDDFRFAADDLPTTIFTNKTHLILTDLNSIDSATRAQAIAALNDAPFKASDLPLLHKAFLLPYKEDDEDYKTIPDRLQEVIAGIKDSSTTAFIQDNYKSTDSVSLSRKPAMLVMLAKQKTTASYELLKVLMLTDRPAVLDNNMLFFQLTDSAQLAQLLFPACAALFGDSTYGAGLISVATKLVDSGLIEKSIIINNAKGVIATANRQLKSLQKDKDAYLPFENEVMNALGMINTTESIGKINSYLKSNDIYRKLEAATVLVNVSQKLQLPDITRLASNVDTRIDFYSMLKKAGKENLFPVVFRTQQKFAESYLVSEVSEEDQDEMKFTFVKEKTATVEGKLQRFFIFKATAPGEESTENYAAICGPFDMNKALPLVTKKYPDIQIFYDEKFVLTKLDKQFDQYLQAISNAPKKTVE